MEFNEDLIICNSQEFKKALRDWLPDWYSKRPGRQVFFLAGPIESPVTEILKRYRSLTSDSKIDVIIESPGGQMEASFKSTIIFQSCCPEYVAFVPRSAKSGATLFSLGATEIVMGRWAELGPLDPQGVPYQAERQFFREEESALESFHAALFAQREVLKHLDSYYRWFLDDFGLSARSALSESTKLIEATIGRIYANVSPFELGRTGRSLELMQRYCLTVMERNYKTESLRKTSSEKLVWDYPEHGYPIYYDEAKKLNLNVRKATDDEQDLLDKLIPLLKSGLRCLGMLIPKPEQQETTIARGDGNAATEETNAVRN